MLTDKEIDSLAVRHFGVSQAEDCNRSDQRRREFARAIEAASTSLLLARIAELERQLAQARKGAERYRKLRAQVYVDPVQRILRISGIWLVGSGPVLNLLDDAIDAAIQAEVNHHHPAHGKDAP
jgi:hypothetical protein